MFADDLCIWSSDNSLKSLSKKLQTAINQVQNYCSTWGLTLNKTKTNYTVFTTAGNRTNYKRTYNLKLKLKDKLIPLEPTPTFLGIKLDPKLSYRNHLDHIFSKISAKINLIRKIKSLKLKNQLKICKTIFKSSIRPIFDYSFIILQSSTQKIVNELQKIQNRILKQIKFYPIKTKTEHIHRDLNIQTIKQRTKALFLHFTLSRRNDDFLNREINSYAINKTPNNKFETLFDQFNIY